MSPVFFCNAAAICFGEIRYSIMGLAPGFLGVLTALETFHSLNAQHSLSDLTKVLVLSSSLTLLIIPRSASFRKLGKGGDAMELRLTRSCPVRFEVLIWVRLRDFASPMINFVSVWSSSSPLSHS